VHSQIREQLEIPLRLGLPYLRRPTHPMTSESIIRSSLRETTKEMGHPHSGPLALADRKPVRLWPPPPTGFAQVVRATRPYSPKFSHSLRSRSNRSATQAFQTAGVRDRANDVLAAATRADEGRGDS
jgi:hypothetical protein